VDLSVACVPTDGLCSLAYCNECARITGLHIGENKRSRPKKTEEGKPTYFFIICCETLKNKCREIELMQEDSSFHALSLISCRLHGEKNVRLVACSRQREIFVRMVMIKKT